MLSYREMLNIFLGRNPVELFSANRISLRFAVFSHAVAFFSVSIFFTIELVLFSFVAWIFSRGDFASFIILVGMILLAAIILIPASFFVQVVCAYMWGALHFFIAGFFSNRPETLNDFNGAFISIIASTKFAAGLMFLVPVLGWFAAGLVQFYNIVLFLRLVRSKFNLTDAQAAIVVLIPADLLLVGLLLLSIIISFVLIGPKVL